MPQQRRQRVITRRAVLVAAALSAVGGSAAVRPERAGFVRAGSRRRGLGGPGQRAQFRDLVKCGSRVLNVSGDGDDAADGTEDHPLRQISAALSRVAPGDLVLVGDGTYGFTEIRGFEGAPDRWLGLMTRDDGVRATITVPPPTDNFVNVVGSSFVGLYGFEVAGDLNNPNTNGSGISVHADSHHVALWANDVHDFPGGGINCFDVGGAHDLVDVRYNHVHRTSRYSPNNTSGISIFAPADLTNGELFDDGYGFRVVGNYIHDILCTVPFTPGGFDFVTDGNGISLDKVFTTYGYRKPILVRDNIITGCGGRAVHAFETVSVDIDQNTAIGNLRTVSPAISGGVEIDGTTDRSVRITANAILPLNTDNTTDMTSSYTGNAVLGGTQPVPPGNGDLRGWEARYFSGPLTAGGAVDGYTQLEPLVPRWVSWASNSRGHPPHSDQQQNPRRAGMTSSQRARLQP